MKKLLIFVIICMLCLPGGTVFAEEFTVSADIEQADRGETAEIKISLNNNSGIIAALLSVEYDRERLELTEVQDMRLLPGGTFSPTYRDYPYKMLWNSAADTDFTEDGALAVLRFRVLEDAPAGKAAINLSYNQNDVFDVELNNVHLTVVNGYIEVPQRDSQEVVGGGNADSSLGGHRYSGSSGVKNPVTLSEEEKKKSRIVLTLGKKEAMVYGTQVTNDVAPVARNGRTMLPARFVAENLGAKVEWNPDAWDVVTITKDDTVIVITIDSQIAIVNGAAIVLESPAFAENNRTYTPLRFIAEKLGAQVEWNGETQEVIITKAK